MKVSQLEGGNIELAINQMKSMLNILQNANHLPDDVLELLLKYFLSSSNKDFNDVFKALLNNYKLYGTGTVGTPQHISTAIIYSKALQLYEEAVDIKAWIKIIPKDATAAIGNKTAPSEDGSDKSRKPQFPDLTKKKLEISQKVAAGHMTLEEAKATRKNIEKEKAQRCKKTDKVPR